MLFSYGDAVTINSGFYAGHTGVINKVVLTFEEETTIFNYIVRLDVAPADLTDFVVESNLTAV